MIERPKRPMKIHNQDNKQPQTIEQLIRRYDLDNTKIYDFLDELIMGLTNMKGSLESEIQEGKNKNEENFTKINEEISNLKTKTYPIGSVHITNVNNNPSETLGGTWELIDKEFIPKMGAVAVTLNEANSCTVHCSRANHTIYMRIQFVNTNELNDTQTTIGTLDLSALGVTDLSYQKYAVGYSDGGQGVIMASILSDGVLVVYDVIGKSETTISAGNNCAVDFVHVVSTDSMLDEACNKFYWKRIA
ncbi:MAG: hypothetical protein IKL68_02200 [Clostridia bacterium]|nr:hypothetical protein [Clostridia bacterium]